MTDVNFGRVGATGCACISLAFYSIHNWLSYTRTILSSYLSDAQRWQTLVHIESHTHTQEEVCTITTFVRTSGVCMSVHNDNKIHNKSRLCFGAKVNFVVLCSADKADKWNWVVVLLFLHAAYRYVRVRYTRVLQQYRIVVQHAIGSFYSWNSILPHIQWRALYMLRL